MIDLDGIYAALDDDDAYAALPATVARAAGTRSALLTRYAPDGTILNRAHGYWTDDAWDLYYKRHIWTDPFRTAAVSSGITDRAIAFDEVLPPERFYRTALYDEIVRPLGDDTGRAMGYVPGPGRGGLILAAQRAARDRPFTRADTVRLGVIHGHVDRILRLRALLADERHVTLGLAAMLDASDRPILLVDRYLTVQRASAAGLAWLRQADGIAVQRGSVVPNRPRDLQALRGAVASVLDKRSGGPPALILPKQAGGGAFRIAVLPAGLTASGGAVLLIDDPDVRLDAPLARFAAAYRLTAAEAALTRGLAAGHDIAAIADRRGVGRETIRSQLKSLFAKTGVNRQAALIRLIATMP